MTDFRRRLAMQKAKMQAISAEILKIDFHYKLPKKIKVYTGRGQAFTPFKCALSIQNEDALAVF